jgi:hypothetical protein
MPAKIIGQNHKVTTYELNGRKRHIVENIPKTFNRLWVNRAVAAVGRNWNDVYNWLDNEIQRNGGSWDDFPGLHTAVDNMTY